MFPLDEGDQAFGLLTVLGPAGLLQLLGEGRHPIRAEGGARRFEGAGQLAYGVVVLSLPGLLQAGVGCWNDQGYLASITLRSPPRAANSPVTFACTGRQAFTTSCRIRLTAFS
jgi:hypothetical protein